MSVAIFTTIMRIWTAFGAFAEEQKEQTIPGVTILTFFRSQKGSQYELGLTQENIEVVATTSIDWCFPDGWFWG